MAQDELLDLVNKQDEVIGTVWKSVAHKDPSLIHREVAVIVFNDRKETLLQQRSMQKKLLPGLWTVTAAGHILAGENPKVAIERELKEELGISVDLIFDSKRLYTFAAAETKFLYLYYGLVHGRPRTTLQPEEVMATDWVPVNKIEDFAKNHSYNLESYSHTKIMELAKKLGLL